MKLMRTVVLALALLAACRSTEPKIQLMSSERKEFIGHMGHIQKLMFELQSETGEPLDQQAINKLLDKMIFHWESARKVRIGGDEKYVKGLDQMFEHTVGQVQAVRAKTWTKDSVGEYFSIVDGTCRACHDRFAP